MKLLRLLFVAIIAILLCMTPASFAADLTSTSFILRDPIIGAGGGYGTSTSFQLISADNILGSSASSSATYINHNGFLYYPFVTKGTFSGSPSGSSAVITWTATTAGQGLGVAGYSLGKSTVSGSGYTFTSVGNVLTYTYNSLTPGTYYFVLRTLDNLGNIIATSSEINVVISQVVSFSISSNVSQFGILSSAISRYANSSGGTTTETEAHNLVANTNAPSGYTITIQGATPAHLSSSITAIGATNTAPATGTSQFGLRAVPTGGTGAVTTSYAGSGFAYAASSSTASSVATETVGDALDTTYSIRYLVNIDPFMPAGDYATNLVYVVTPNF